jgi:hypothetical protein
MIGVTVDMSARHVVGGIASFGRGMNGVMRRIKMLGREVPA